MLVAIWSLDDFWNSLTAQMSSIFVLIIISVRHKSIPSVWPLKCLWQYTHVFNYVQIRASVWQGHLFSSVCVTGMRANSRGVDFGFVVIKYKAYLPSILPWWQTLFIISTRAIDRCCACHTNGMQHVQKNEILYITNKHTNINNLFKDNGFQQ